MFFSLMLLVGYFLGAISCAILLCKIAGLPDPRESGSNNPGATNVLRLGGKKMAFLVLFGDALKGFIPVIGAGILFDFSIDQLAWIGLAACLGHLYPIYFNFQGGKGVATAIGVLFALNWMLGLSFVIIWALVAAIFRYSSLAALVAISAMPIGIYVLFNNALAIIPMTIITILVLWRHGENIKRLMAGLEPKIGQKTGQKS